MDQSEREPTMTLEQLAQAIRGDGPERLTDAQCREALIFLLGYSRLNNGPSHEVHIALAWAVESPALPPLEFEEPAGPGGFTETEPGVFERVTEATQALEDQGETVCGCCKRSPVRRPGEGSFLGRFCGECIDRCHDFEIADHRCPVCAEPDVLERASE
jgi:hypothetical protein